jgi:ATP-dependent protease ClpP protease subunit
MSKNEWLKIKNQTDTSAEMYISGDIVGDDIGGTLEYFGDDGTGYNWPNNIKQQLDAVGDKDLTVYINSGGGDVFAGMAIANMIKRHKCQTTAVVDGYCCSIATQILFAADKCKMPKNAYLMIHKPATCACGDANDMRKTIDVLDTIQQGIETTYNDAAKEGVSADKIHEMTENETWLTGEAAAEVFNIEVLDAVQAVAYAGDTAKFFKNKPENLHFMTEKQPPEPPKPTDNAAKIAAENKKKSQKAQIALALAKGSMIV